MCVGARVASISWTVTHYPSQLSALVFFFFHDQRDAKIEDVLITLLLGAIASCALHSETLLKLIAIHQVSWIFLKCSYLVKGWNALVCNGGRESKCCRGFKNITTTVCRHRSRVLGRDTRDFRTENDRDNGVRTLLLMLTFPNCAFAFLKDPLSR